LKSQSWRARARAARAQPLVASGACAAIGHHDTAVHCCSVAPYTMKESIAVQNSGAVHCCSVGYTLKESIGVQNSGECSSVGVGAGRGVLMGDGWSIDG
jgi:hypothetical protein